MFFFTLQYACTAGEEGNASEATGSAVKSLRGHWLARFAYKTSVKAAGIAVATGATAAVVAASAAKRALNAAEHRYGAAGAAGDAATGNVTADGCVTGPVKAVRLYSPRRLLHLQRRGDDSVALVDGLRDECFEYIAVRASWLIDHFLTSYEKDLDALLTQLA